MIKIGSTAHSFILYIETLRTVAWVQLMKEVGKVLLIALEC